MPKEIHDRITESAEQMGGKIETLFNMIQKNEEKFIVFTRFHSTWQLICKYMQQRNIQYVCIEGKMTPEKRFENIQKFQSDANVKVFAMTTKTASVGITLTAGSHVVFLEPCENEAIKKQAIGRAWRIGQTKPVTVTTLKTEGTIDCASDLQEHIHPPQIINELSEHAGIRL
jgi:SNF2 family DNA or RNA helicase